MNDQNAHGKLWAALSNAADVSEYIAAAVAALRETNAADYPMTFQLATNALINAHGHWAT